MLAPYSTDCQDWYFRYLKTSIPVEKQVAKALSPSTTYTYVVPSLFVIDNTSVH